MKEIDARRQLIRGSLDGVLTRGPGTIVEHQDLAAKHIDHRAPERAVGGVSAETESRNLVVRFEANPRIAISALDYRVTILPPRLE